MGSIGASVVPSQVQMLDHLPAGHQEASPIVSKAGSPRIPSGSWSSESGRSGNTKSSSSIAGAPSTEEEAVAGLSGDDACTAGTSGADEGSAKGLCQGVSDGGRGEE